MTASDGMRLRTLTQGLEAENDEASATDMSHEVTEAALCH